MKKLIVLASFIAVVTGCNKKQGDKSELILLTDKQKIDVYSGTNLSIDKKNSVVNGEVIQNSGVSNFVLVIDETSFVQKNINEYFLKTSRK